MLHQIDSYWRVRQRKNAETDDDDIGAVIQRVDEEEEDDNNVDFASLSFCGVSSYLSIILTS